MQPKIILVNQTPGASAQEPIEGTAGRRLAALADLEHDEFLERFEHVSLEPEGRASSAKVLERADTLRLAWKGRKVVLLGETVAAAFRLPRDEYEWFQSVELPPGFEVAVMPTPRGVGNWWNDEKNVQNARRFMQRIKLGYLVFRRVVPKRERGGRTEQFTPDAIAAALVAADGVDKYAAEALAEETGISCTGETIRNYIAAYPGLADVKSACREDGLDIAEHNVKRAIRAGDVETSRWLLRSKAAWGRGYELAVEGRVKHEGVIDHRHAHLHARLDAIAERLSAQEVDMLRGVYEKLAEVAISDTDDSGSG